MWDGDGIYVELVEKVMMAQNDGRWSKCLDVSEKRRLEDYVFFWVDNTWDVISGKLEQWKKSRIDEPNPNWLMSRVRAQSARVNPLWYQMEQPNPVVC